MRKIIANILIFVLTGLRPLLGPATCRYAEACTMFACRQLEQRPLGVALYNIIKRLLSCSPLSSLK